MPSSPSTVAAVGQPVDLNKLIEPIQGDFAIVEEWLRSNLIDDSSFITQLLAQIFEAGGKRIRPAVVLLSSRATLPKGSDFSRLHIILAVLTELIHTASLVHDDVIDGANLRRGVATVNRRFSDRIAVLMGDLLFAQASICLARLMNPVIVGIYGRVLGDLCAGEIRQMQQQFAVFVDWPAYISKSVAKTASLFCAGSHSGAILNGAGDQTVMALKDYGLNLGICFQIVDDLLDVIGTGERLGKDPGSDLRSGIITAPALFILEKNDGPASQLAKLIKSRLVCERSGSEEAIELIKKHGGVESTIALAKTYAQASVQCLDKLPESQYRDALNGMVDYVLTRVN